MRFSLLLGLLIITSLIAKGQYSFEKYPAIHYNKESGWKVYDRKEKEGKLHWVISVPHFYKDQDSITIQLTKFIDKDSSFIRIFKNKTQIQLFIEPYSIGSVFGILNDTLYYTDINGDGLLDIKIMYWYGGCGIASLNERVIYLIQKPNFKFMKVSYLDKLPSMRLERDFDGDGNYEIITMNLKRYAKHNYWTFNLYNFTTNDFQLVNSKFDYPIMIQYLFKENYEITNKINKSKMKSFESKTPINFDIIKS